MIDPRSRLLKIGPPDGAASGSRFSLQDSVSCVSNSPEAERRGGGGGVLARSLDGLRQMAYSGFRIALLRLAARHLRGNVR
jgi:hypothetical protein